jgi:hypothetical protein
VALAEASAWALADALAAPPIFALADESCSPSPPQPAITDRTSSEPKTRYRIISSLSSSYKKLPISIVREESNEKTRVFTACKKHGNDDIFLTS